MLPYSDVKGSDADFVTENACLRYHYLLN